MIFAACIAICYVSHAANEARVTEGKMVITVMLSVPRAGDRLEGKRQAG